MSSPIAKSEDAQIRDDQTSSHCSFHHDIPPTALWARRIKQGKHTNTAKTKTQRKAWRAEGRQISEWRHKRDRKTSRWRQFSGVFGPDQGTRSCFVCIWPVSFLILLLAEMYYGKVSVPFLPEYAKRGKSTDHDLTQIEEQRLHRWFGHVVRRLVPNWCLWYLKWCWF